MGESTSGYMFIIGYAALSWSSKKQPIVSLSSYKAKYIAPALCACEAILLRNLMKEMHHPQNQPTQIYTDNMSALALA